MSEIGAYEAKTNLSALLGRVEKGERFVITRHGKAVAELVPVGGRDAEKIRRAIGKLREFQREHQLGASARSMVQEGRKR
ncbi:MAG: type II toxin-antitoxin system prevent-host-death family antitoxin [Thermoanaerobaculia bacterium]|nr:type II toxin-antitoxin system prevent-host-death family antitoxin [Thermoanaerobaculia bacterium]